jgi:hypothetical protein
MLAAGRNRVVFEALNPYQSPATADRGLLVERPLHPGTRGRLLAKGLLYRRVMLEAPIEAVVEFDGRSLYDVIRVDNQVVAWNFSWWRITPIFRFVLSAGDRSLEFVVQLHLGHFLRMKGFRIQVEGATVYAEGTFRVSA